MLDGGGPPGEGEKATEIRVGDKCCVENWVGVAGVRDRGADRIEIKMLTVVCSGQIQWTRSNTRNVHKGHT